MSPIQIHLKLEAFETAEGKKIDSCLTAAIREARQITGRNKTTGLPDAENEHSNLGRWSGAMCYMAILDQVGKCYRPTSILKISNGSPIEIALAYFSSLTDNEICAIYALRNAFFHDFSLYNRNSIYQRMQHTFTVENHPTNKVVKLPINSWDGLMSSRNANNNTCINLKTFGDLVEEIYQKLITLESRNELSLELTGGEDELINRYTFMY